MGMRMPFIEALYHRTQCNILVVSYRGYGLSGGYPDEEKMKSDTLVN
jgi:hypothetical protein